MSRLGTFLRYAGDVTGRSAGGSFSGGCNNSVAKAIWTPLLLRSCSWATAALRNSAMPLCTAGIYTSPVFADTDLGLKL
jgi:hypothetical protein